MSQARRVLIADPNFEEVQEIAIGLRARGYHVQHVEDGARALELSVMRCPDVVIFSTQCQLVNAASFESILASNERTKKISVIWTTSALPVDAALLDQHRYLPKPLISEEVYSRIDTLCASRTSGPELSGRADEIEGRLTQLPLLDVLQLLSMNRRTGKLLLSTGNERGEVSISGGRIVNAHFGAVEGERALFRLLSWREGGFSFVPTASSGRAIIDRNLEELLLEGSRQADERERLLKNLPRLDELMTASSGVEVPQSPNAIGVEILECLQQPRRLSELVDLINAPDLEILEALGTLIDGGSVLRFKKSGEEVPPILTTSLAHALRGTLTADPRPLAPVVVQIALCADREDVRWFVSQLPYLVAVSPEPPCLENRFGTLGRVDVGEVVRIDFTLAAVADETRPLWRPFLINASGILVLHDSPEAVELARFCAFDLRIPVIFGTFDATTKHAGAREALAGAPNRVEFVTSSVIDAVRSLVLSPLSRQVI